MPLLLLLFSAGLNVFHRPTLDDNPDYADRVVCYQLLGSQPGTRFPEDVNHPNAVVFEQGSHRRLLKKLLHRCLFAAG